MDTLESRLQARKLKFLAKCRDRLAMVHRALQASPLQIDELRAANRDLHQIAGAAGIYELDELAQTAIACEEACTRLLENPAEPDATGLLKLIARLQSLVDVA